MKTKTNHKKLLDSLSYFVMIYSLFYSSFEIIDKKDELSIFERLINMIVSFLFALFFYILLILPNKKHSQKDNQIMKGGIK